MAAKRAVSVRIRGEEFRVRTDHDESSLQRVADYLSETMATVEARTGTVDSRDLALLSALNLAREVVELRDALPAAGAVAADGERVRALIERVESALQTGAR